MCAMHDIDAAAGDTGFAPDQLSHYRELGIRRLVMREPNGTSEWEPQLDVFPLVRTEGRAAAPHALPVPQQHQCCHDRNSAWPSATVRWPPPGCAATTRTSLRRGPSLVEELGR
jgi:hypothetical protein